MSKYSVYLHIPFCQHRCGYCDFNTYAGQEERIPNYVEALCAEIEEAWEVASGTIQVHTIFFGGGTPSLLSTRQIAQILEKINQRFTLLPHAEISLEANPGTVSGEYLRDLRQLGVNRLSLGVQSANPAELKLLERIHSYPDAVQAVKWARQAGFDNLNLDLIFGLPEQSLDSWQRSLHLAACLQPEHFALYALTMEQGTPFGNWSQRGLLSTPDPDMAAEMYEWASEHLEKDGYTQYEISNWAHQRAGSPPLPATANPDFACRHNLQYWRNQPYLGFGAGAHGYAAGIRTANTLVPAVYIQRCLETRKTQHGENEFPRTQATASAIRVDRAEEIGETMMMGLRLRREGVSQALFMERFEQRLEEVFKQEIERNQRRDLLEWSGGAGDTLRLTKKGLLLGNQVFMDFI